MTAKTAPTWTRARLERVMRLRFGETPRGAVNTTAAAAELGVSAGTVRRWLNAPSGRSLAHIPAPRLEQLIALLLPAEETLRREAQQAQYAEQALQQCRAGLVNRAWEQQRWLERHAIVIIESPATAGQRLKIHQLAITRAEPAKLEELQKRGRVIEQRTLATRFHATIASQQILEELLPWRFQAQAQQVKQGFTKAWLTDAPAAQLARAARRAAARFPLN